MTENKEKRLLFVVNVGWFFMSHRLPLAIEARRLGYDVHVACALDPHLDAHTVEALTSARITVHEIGFSRSGANPFELFKNFWRIATLIARVKPDIVHLVTLKPILMGGIAARILRMDNVVIAVPGRGTVFSKGGAFAALRRAVVLLLYRLAYKPNRNRVIVQNVEDRDYFVDRNIFRRADVALIRGSGVDVVRFALCSEPATIPVVGLASRMLREKGVVDFVAAASELKRQGVQARFVLIGDPDFGNPDSHTVEELQQWAAAGAVEWWGKQNNMADVLARCHIVTLPTYYGEGVPKVLIEAAAVGRPIVTTNLPGCRDIVRDEVNGILIAPRDSHLLADALARLIANPQLRVEMGVRGRALVEQEFSLHIVIKQTFDLYDSLLGA